MLLGLPWLKEHNPEVDWTMGEVKMSRCPAKCRTCKDEMRAEAKTRHAEIQQIRTCRIGPFPTPEADWDGIPDLITDSDDDNEEEEGEDVIKEGDRVFFA